MADIDERLERIDQAVKTTNQQLADLRERHGQILERHGRMLEHHGRLLNQIAADVAPLKVLPDFIQRVASEHELRIAALEKGSRQN